MKPTYEELAVQLANSESKCRELAVENGGLKADQVRIFNSGYQRGHEATVEGYYVDIHQNDMTTYHEDIVAEIAEEQTPATDAFLAEVRATALDEFAIAQDEQAKKYYELSPGCSGQNECQYAAGQAWYSAECIRKSAAQLRKGAAL